MQKNSLENEKLNMSKEKKGKLHPIVERALEMVTPDIETLEFDDYAVEQIQDLLRELFGKPDLMNAVIELLKLATVLDKQGHNSAAIKIITAACVATEGLKKEKRSAGNSDE